MGGVYLNVVCLWRNQVLLACGTQTGWLLSSQLLRSPWAKNCWKQNSCCSGAAQWPTFLTMSYCISSQSAHTEHSRTLSVSLHLKTKSSLTNRNTLSGTIVAKIFPPNILLLFKDTTRTGPVRPFFTYGSLFVLVFSTASVISLLGKWVEYPGHHVKQIVSVSVRVIVINRHSA